MDYDKRKLDNFTKAFLMEASRRSADIISGANASREQIQKEIEAALDVEVDEYKKKKLAEVKNREGSRVSAQLLENKRTLLNFREQCSKEILEDVLKRIDEFESFDRYPDHLVNLFLEAQKELREDMSVVVLLRGEDLQYADRIRSVSKMANTTFKEGSFELGGLVIICPSANIRIDQTFDSALDDARLHFAELSGIDLE